MLLVHDDRTAAVHDLATGRLLASAEAAGRRLRPGQPGRGRRAARAAGTRPRRHGDHRVRPGDAAAASGPRPAGYASRSGAVRRAGLPRPGPTGSAPSTRPTACSAGTGTAGAAIEQRGRRCCSRTASPDGDGDPIGIVDPATGTVARRPATAGGWSAGSGAGPAARDPDVDAGSPYHGRRRPPGRRATAACSPTCPPAPATARRCRAGWSCRSSGTGELVVWAYRAKG